MINDNIRRYRKEKKLSQEEMAIKLCVVRQTVSKWENGLSVPDADVLIKMADLLEVSVNKLLGIEIEQNNIENLTEELAKLNELLARKRQEEKLIKRANEKRGIILLLSFISMIIALGLDNPILSIILSAGCILSAVVILYRDLALMTCVTTENMKMNVLRITTVVNIIALIAAVILSILTATGIILFSQENEEIFGMIFIAGIIIFAGIISPRLPFTRHTGLRLPWTVEDKDTWDLAHKIIGYISLPVALLYVACSLTINDFEKVSFVAMILWIGIPSGISYIFYWKKMYGRV